MGPTLLTLPKEDYEVLVVDSDNQGNRYGGEMDWDMEIDAADVDEAVDLKLQK